MIYFQYLWYVYMTAWLEVKVTGKKYLYYDTSKKYVANYRYWESFLFGCPLKTYRRNSYRKTITEDGRR